MDRNNIAALLQGIATDIRGLRGEIGSLAYSKLTQIASRIDELFPSADRELVGVGASVSLETVVVTAMQGDNVLAMATYSMPSLLTQVLERHAPELDHSVLAQMQVLMASKGWPVPTHVIAEGLRVATRVQIHSGDKPGSQERNLCPACSGIGSVAAGFEMVWPKCSIRRALDQPMRTQIRRRNQDGSTTPIVDRVDLVPTYERYADPAADPPAAAVDVAALEVARRFTSDDDPQQRAQLQVAVVGAIQQFQKVEITDDVVNRAYDEMRRYDCFFIFGQNSLKRLIREWFGAAFNKGN